MKKIKLTNSNKYATVDDSYYEKFIGYKWYLSGTGYASYSEWDKVSKKGKTIYMHRLVANTPKGKQTDHINMNKLDNRKDNLRNCTRTENLGHIALSSHNKSGLKGVGVRNNKWRAYISNKNKHIHLGYFSTKELAAKAYNVKALELFGEFALLNKI